MKDSKEIIIKSNKLIWMQSNLSVIQLKIFAKVIWSVVKRQENEYYRFNIKSLLDDFCITDTNYTALKNATKNMIKAVVLKTADWEHQFSLFTDVIYDRGIVDMYLHSKIKPLILDIEKRYTKYYFENVAKLNSRYSILIYEFLKEYEFRKSRVFEIDNLKFLLNIWKDRYPRYYDFKKYVLLQAQKELKEKTDISFEFEEIREARKVVRINFIIITQNKIVSETSNSLQNSISGLLKTKILLKDKQIKTVLKQYDEAYIKRNIDYTLSQKNIKNIPGYFLKALELDYGKSLFENNEKKKKHDREVHKKDLDQKKEAENIKLKKQKINEYIENHPDEVIELIPGFLEDSREVLLKTWISKDDLETDNVKEVILWDKKVKWLKSAFRGYVDSKLNKEDITL